MVVRRQEGTPEALDALIDNVGFVRSRPVDPHRLPRRQVRRGPLLEVARHRPQGWRPGGRLPPGSLVGVEASGRDRTGSVLPCRSALHRRWRPSGSVGVGRREPCVVPARGVGAALSAGSAARSSRPTLRSWECTFPATTRSSGHRSRLVKWLRKNYDRQVKFWPEPNQHAVRGDDLTDLYASVKVVVGDSCLVPKPDGSPMTHYCSDRIPETLGRGGLLLHPVVEDVTGKLFNHHWWKLGRLERTGGADRVAAGRTRRGASFVRGGGSARGATASHLRGSDAPVGRLAQRRKRDAVINIEDRCQALIGNGWSVQLEFEVMARSADGRVCTAVGMPSLNGDRTVWGVRASRSAKPSRCCSGESAQVDQGIEANLEAL